MQNNGISTESVPTKTHRDGLKAILDIAAILYQVNDMKLAMDIILDTITEILQISKVGLSLSDAVLEEFHVSYHRNLGAAFEKDFSFNPYKLINGHAVHLEEKTVIPVSNGEVKVNKADIKIAENIKQLLLYPVRFHEQTIAFIVFVSETDAPMLNSEQEHLLEVFSTIIGPVLYAFDMPVKSKNSFENIISKIIKDRVYESRLVLNPISFVVFRIVIKEQLTDTLILEQAIIEYQKVFQKLLSPKGDLIWLTADTAFFIFPNADLFVVESLSTDLNKKIKGITLQNENKEVFSLKYACISYPQSGDNAREIINKLWLKLYEELYLMES